MLEPWVKGSLEEQRVWLAPSWQDEEDRDVPFINRTQLQRTLSRIGRNSGVNFFVTYTREEETGMNGAEIATKQLESYRGQRGFPLNDYVILVVVRSKRKYNPTGRYTYAAGLRVGRLLRLAGFTEADQARVLQDAGPLLQWDNPDPSPEEFATQVCGQICKELSATYIARRRRRS